MAALLRPPAGGAAAGPLLRVADAGDADDGDDVSGADAPSTSRTPAGDDTAPLPPPPPPPPPLLPRPPPARPSTFMSSYSARRSMVGGRR